MLLTYDEYIEEFGKNLRQKRKEIGVTINELSDACGIAKSTLGSYERGQCLPNAYALYVLADYFNCPTEDLVYV